MSKRDEEIVEVVDVKKRWRWLMSKRDEEIMEVVDVKKR